MPNFNRNRVPITRPSRLRLPFNLILALSHTFKGQVKEGRQYNIKALPVAWRHRLWNWALPRLHNLSCPLSPVDSASICSIGTTPWETLNYTEGQSTTFEEWRATNSTSFQHAGFSHILREICKVFPWLTTPMISRLDQSHLLSLPVFHDSPVTLLCCLLPLFYRALFCWLLC